MKGKQAILRYLETHRTFTAKDVATECGMTINCITKNAIDLERARKIVRCHSCDAQSAQMVGANKINMAIAAWNKRVGEAAQ